MKKKASFETLKKLFDESWERYKAKAFNWLIEWTKIREENGWSLDEFELAMDKFNEKQNELEMAAKKTKIEKAQGPTKKVA